MVESTLCQCQDANEEMMYSCLRRASCWPPFELAHLVIKCIIPSEPCLDKLIYNPGTLDIAEKCKMCPTHIFLTWSKTFNDLIKVLSFGRQISRHFLDWFKKRSLDLNLLMKQQHRKGLLSCLNTECFSRPIGSWNPTLASYWLMPSGVSSLIKTCNLTPQH